jgi:hypothetical protein
VLTDEFQAEIDNADRKIGEWVKQDQDNRRGEQHPDNANLMLQQNRVVEAQIRALFGGNESLNPSHGPQKDITVTLSAWPVEQRVYLFEGAHDAT